MFGKQFVMARSRGRIGNAYDVRSFGGWYLGTAPDLAITSLRLTDDRHVLLVGHPQPTAATATALASGCETEAVYSFAGTYIALVEDRDDVILYLDPSGSLPAVYSAEAGVVAANPHEIYEHDYDLDLVREYPINAGQFFPFALTAKRRVSRLLPNHRLFLRDMRVERHWPTALVEGKYSVAENIETIARQIEATIASVAERHDLILPLTAGYDSRVLLACSKSQPIRCFTSLIDEAGHHDAEVARRLAVAANVSHEPLPFLPPTSEERERWLDSTGRCVGGRASFNFKTIADASRNRVLVMGLAGEVCRAFWADGSADSNTLQGVDLLNRLNLNHTLRGNAAADDWLAKLRHLSAHQILDLLYIEVRLGCWAGPQMAAEGPSLFRIAPFSARAIFERALDLPVAARRAKVVPSTIVATRRPELALIPYNPPLNLYRQARRSIRRIGKKLAA